MFIFVVFTTACIVKKLFIYIPFQFYDPLCWCYSPKSTIDCSWLPVFFCYPEVAVRCLQLLARVSNVHRQRRVKQNERNAKRSAV